MNKFNIYRILFEKKTELISKFESVGLIQIGSKKVDEYDLDFYFSPSPEEFELGWFEPYSEFFDKAPVPKVKNYFGALIISNDDICYAISLGRSHFYIKGYCDLDFGLNLAERILDRNNLKIKSSRFFKSRKSQIITTYHNNCEIDCDSGESLHFIKGKTVDPQQWGNSVSFGNSVQFCLDKTPSDLPLLLDNIEKKLVEPKLIDVPRVDQVKDKTAIEALDKKLVDAIYEDNEIQSVAMEEFVLTGVNFLPLDAAEYSIYVRGQFRNRENFDILNIENLLKFINKSGIDLYSEIDNIQVEVRNDDGSKSNESIKYFLDFVEEDERCCLIEGNWFRFNQSFFEFLQKEADELPINYEAIFDTPKGIIEEGFNKLRVQEGFINYDRIITQFDNRYSIEKFDLYKDNEIIFVKMGIPQKLGYVFDQSILTAKLIQHNEGKILIEDKQIQIERICIWVILNRKNWISKLSEIKSIIFLMKLVEWKKTVEDINCTPIVRVNYQKEKTPDKLLAQ